MDMIRGCNTSQETQEGRNATIKRDNGNKSETQMKTFSDIQNDNSYLCICRRGNLEADEFCV